MGRKLKLEYKILGHLIIQPFKFEEALDIGLKASWFSSEELKKIFNQMLEQFEKKGQVEMSILDISDNLFEILESYGETVVFIEETIKELKKINKKEYFQKSIKDIMIQESIELEEKIFKIHEIFEKIEEKENQNLKIYNAEDTVNSNLNRIGKKEIKGVKNPFPNAGKYFDLISGQLIIIGARPSMGKSALGIAFVREVAKKENALFVSLEMPNTEIDDRLVASTSDVSLQRIMHGNLNQFEIQSLNIAYQEILESKINYIVPETYNFETIVRDIKKIHAKTPFKLIVIDYLTLMSSTRKILSNRNLEVEYMANELKRLAKTLDTCIIALAQLNRGKEVQGSKPKKPTLSDLRDSGGIEQAADVVGLLYREDYYDDEKRQDDFVILEMLVRKNRQGQTGDIQFGYKKSTQKISGGSHEK